MEFKATESGLLVPKEKSFVGLNLVKKDPMQRLRSYMEDLRRADPVKGKARAEAVYKKIGDLVHDSFGKSVLPIRGEPTKAMINERLDKCVELVLALNDQGWVSTRIIDELQQIFFNSLVEGETRISNRKSWGVRETNEVEFDFSEEHNE